MKNFVTPLILVSVLFSAAACAQLKDRLDDALQVKNDNLLRDGNPFVIRGLIISDFAAPSQVQDNLLKVYPPASESGFNTICFDIHGLNADDSDIDKAALTHIIDIINQLATRRIGIVINLFPAGVPTDAGYRNKVVETAAKAFKDELRAAYWIQGDDAAGLAKKFHAIAPDPLVFGIDIATVNAVADVKPGKPAAILGSVPSRENIATTHFLVENKPEYHAALDAALANPAESAPWTPDNSRLSEQERAEGFVSLFDGKTLNGWWVIGQNEEGFGVKDGAIEWKSRGGAALYTRDRYDNFILRLDWKISPNGNSGIYIRAPRANRQSMAGMEIQIQGDHGKELNYHHTGSIYSAVPASIDATNPDGEWNSYEITCNGPHVKVVLNDKVVLDTNMDEDPILKHRLRRGFIGLQDHGRYVAFKNIRIKRL